MASFEVVDMFLIGLFLGSLLAYLFYKQDEKKRIEQIEAEKNRNYVQLSAEFEHYKREATRIANEMAQKAVLINESSNRTANDSLTKDKLYYELNQLLTEALIAMKESSAGEYWALKIKYEKLLALLN